MLESVAKMKRIFLGSNDAERLYLRHRPSVKSCRLWESVSLCCAGAIIGRIIFLGELHGKKDSRNSVCRPFGVYLDPLPVSSSTGQPLVLLSPLENFRDRTFVSFGFPAAFAPKFSVELESAASISIFMLDTEALSLFSAGKQWSPWLLFTYISGIGCSSFNAVQDVNKVEAAVWGVKLGNRHSWPGRKEVSGKLCNGSEDKCNGASVLLFNVVLFTITSSILLQSMEFDLTRCCFTGHIFDVHEGHV